MILELSQQELEMLYNCVRYTAVMERDSYMDDDSDNGYNHLFMEATKSMDTLRRAG